MEKKIPVKPDTYPIKELFYLLRGFVSETPVDTAPCMPVVKELVYLSGIHGLQPVLYNMLQSDMEQIEARYPGLPKELRNHFIAAVYQEMQHEFSVQEMAEQFRTRGLRLIFFKGVWVRSYYPEPQLRTMGDIDCLILEEDRQKAHEIMLGLGYSCDIDKGYVWVYRRGSVMVEMHSRIAGNGISNQFGYMEYFCDAFQHTEERDGITYLERDYQICYLFYHIAKHLSSTGAGIRMILDIGILARCFDEAYWERIAGMLEQIHLTKVAAAIFQLCKRWFDITVPWKEQVGEETLDQLEDYIITGGTFGFETHDTGDFYLRKSQEGTPAGGKASHYAKLARIYLFPKAENMVQILPAVERHPWLLPAAWVKRWWLGAFKRRGHSLHTIRSMMKKDEGRARREHSLLKELGL